MLFYILFLSLSCFSAFANIDVPPFWEVHNSHKNREQISLPNNINIENDTTEQTEEIFINKEAVLNQLRAGSLLKKVCLKEKTLCHNCYAIESILYCARLTTEAHKEFCKQSFKEIESPDNYLYHIVRLGEDNNWSPQQTTREIELVMSLLNKLKNEQ